MLKLYAGDFLDTYTFHGVKSNFKIIIKLRKPPYGRARGVIKEGHHKYEMRSRGRCT